MQTTNKSLGRFRSLRNTFNDQQPVAKSLGKSLGKPLPSRPGAADAPGNVADVAPAATPSVAPAAIQPVQTNADQRKATGVEISNRPIMTGGAGSLMNLQIASMKEANRTAAVQPAAEEEATATKQTFWEFTGLDRDVKPFDRRAESREYARYLAEGMTHDDAARLCMAFYDDVGFAPYPDMVDMIEDSTVPPQYLMLGLMTVAANALAVGRIIPALEASSDIELSGPPPAPDVPEAEYAGRLPEDIKDFAAARFALESYFGKLAEKLAPIHVEAVCDRLFVDGFNNRPSRQEAEYMMRDAAGAAFNADRIDELVAAFNEARAAGFARVGA